MATPYMTEADVRKMYDQYYKDYETKQRAEAQQLQNQSNAQYDNSQRQNYVSYMQGQRELPESLSRMGLTGGAAESSLLRARTNYENNFNNTERGRNAALATIGNNLNSNLSAYRQQLNQAMEDRMTLERDKRIAYEQAMQEQAENRYAKTISGWNTISGIDKEIDRIKKSGTDTWRIAYLRARRAELQEQGAGSGGSGGGGGSYRSSGGGSTTKTTKPKTITPTKEEAAAALRKQLGVSSTNKTTKGNSKPSVNGWFGVNLRRSRRTR